MTTPPTAWTMTATIAWRGAEAVLSQNEPTDPKQAALFAEAAAAHIPPEAEESPTGEFASEEGQAPGHPAQGHAGSGEELANNVHDAWERYETYQAGRSKVAETPSVGGQPGPGSPEWYQAEMGMNCYWCHWSLTGLPQPVVTCPNCGRFPKPPSP